MNPDSAYATGVIPWPAFLHDSLHSSLSQYVGTQTDDVEWKNNFGSTTALSIGTNNTIYFGSRTHLVALNQDQSVKFRYDAGGLVDTPFVSPDGTVYFDNDGNDLYAVAPNGTLKWKFHTNGIVTLPVTDIYGRIYFGSDNLLYSVSPNGAENWRYKTDGLVSFPSVGPDGIIHFGDTDHYIYSINEDGTLRWKYQTGGTTCPVSISNDGIIYDCSSDQFLYAINPDGTVDWNYQSQNAGTPPTIGPDGTVYFNNETGMIALDKNGIAKWKFQPPDTTLQYVTADSAGDLYVSSFENYLYLLNSDGTPKWKFHVDGSVGPVSVGPDGTIYFNSGKGSIYALGTAVPEFGSTAWIIITISIIGVIVISTRFRSIQKV